MVSDGIDGTTAKVLLQFALTKKKEEEEAEMGGEGAK